MLLPTTKHLHLANGEKIIHSGWMGSNKVKRGVPVYFLLTKSALTCYTQKSIQKGKNKVLLRVITGSIGAETVSKSKQGYKLTFYGKESLTSSPRLVDLQNEEPSVVIEWYLILVSLWEPLPGVERFERLPEDIVVPDRLKHYLSKPPHVIPKQSPQHNTTVITLKPQPVVIQTVQPVMYSQPIRNGPGMITPGPVPMPMPMPMHPSPMQPMPMQPAMPVYRTVPQPQPPMMMAPQPTGNLDYPKF